jgi:hypothetical protein
VINDVVATDAGDDPIGVGKGAEVKEAPLAAVGAAATN